MDQDDVGGVVGDHNVLVPTPYSGGEAACAVRVELAVMHCFHMEAMGVVVCWQGFVFVVRLYCRVLVASSLELVTDAGCFAGAQTPPHGLHVATRLHNVALDHIFRGGTVFCGVCKREA